LLVETATRVAREERTMTHALTDHETIRRWAEARGARPVRMKRGRLATLTVTSDDICLDIPGTLADGDVEPISWHEWFRHFDAHELALLIETANRQPSTFNLLVKRTA
jgi:hypothetical protein